MVGMGNQRKKARIFTYPCHKDSDSRRDDSLPHYFQQFFSTFGKKMARLFFFQHDSKGDDMRYWVVVFKYSFIFAPILGKIPILTNVFQMG